jgi:hypothetical protein
MKNGRITEERGLAPATMKKKRWILLDLAQPLHNRPINKISSAEVLYLLKSIEKSGRRETAKKMRSEPRRGGPVRFPDLDALYRAATPVPLTGRALKMPERGLCVLSL